MINFTDCPVARVAFILYVSLFVVESVLARASYEDSFEFEMLLLTSKSSFRYDALPLLVRGGSLDAAHFHENHTTILFLEDNDDGVYDSMISGSETTREGKKHTRAQASKTFDRLPSASSRFNQQMTSILSTSTTSSNKNKNSMRRRIPHNKMTITTDHKKHDSLSYADILQCKAPSLSSSRGEEENIRHRQQRNFLGGGGSSGGNGDRLYDSENRLLTLSRAIPNSQEGRMEGTNKLSHSPVVYQYYGRSRMRGSNSYPARGSATHFILIGPNVDHWKAVGQILASRGFNTIAIERLPDPNIDATQDSPNLVLDMLDALRWDKAVLVGCDKDAILVMETAMILAPDRVAGMVLSGDLSEASRVASEAGVDVLDAFLRRILDCPFLIVWDGATPSIVSSGSSSIALTSDNDSSTCQILGGGSAPHRTKAEQFAWILTRFVEEKIEVAAAAIDKVSPPRISAREDWWRSNRSSSSSPSSRNNPRQFYNCSGRNVFQMIGLPFGVNTIVSPEGRLLLGRAIAAAIFYITIMKVAVVQYGILRSGLNGLRSKYDTFGAVLRRVFQATGAFFVNYGYIPRLFRIKKAAEDDDDIDRESPGAVALSSQSQEGADGTLKEDDPSDDKSIDGTFSVDEDQSLSPTETETDDGENESSLGKDKSGEGEDEESSRSRFKPFFFLDSVVT